MNRFEQKLKKNLTNADFAAGYEEANAELSSLVLSLYTNQTGPSCGTSSVTTVDGSENSFNNLLPYWLVYSPKIQAAPSAV
jgi:hypothetical protein